jgi:hypothetical protein
MLGLVLLLLKQERRYQYRSTTFILYPLITSFFTVMIYWFTSKALTGLTDVNQSWNANSYFDFLILGELVLLLPLAIGESSIRAVRYLANENLLEESLLLPGGPIKAISALSFSMLLPEVLSVLMTAFHACVFFNYSLSLAAFFKIAVLVLVSLPCIYGLGLVGTGLYLRLGRGEGLMSQLNYVAGIFAGAYFPLSVLSTNVAEILVRILPHSALLDMSRKLSVGSDVPYLENLGLFLIFGVAFMGLGILYLNRSIEKLRKGQWPTFSHP